MTTIIDDFTTTTGNLPRTDYWLSSTNALVINSAKARGVVSASVHEGRANFIREIEGDFSITVDWDVVAGSGSTVGWSGELRVLKTSDETNRSNIKFNGQTKQIISTLWIDGNKQQADITNSATTGQFRITRVDSTWTTYYKTTGAWTQADTRAGMYDGAVSTYLSVSNWTNYPAATFDYDNFTVIGESISGGTMSTNPVRGMYEWDGVLYTVMGNSFISVTTANVMTTIGTLSTSSGYIYFAENGTQMAMCDGTYIYYYDGTTFARVSSENLPSVGNITFLNNYLVASQNDSGKMVASEALDFNTWDALDFSTAEYQADDMVRVFTDHVDLFAIGKRTTEFFYSASANTAFPFSPRSQPVLEIGIDAAASVGQVDTSVFWLANTLQAIKVSGYRYQVISTPQLERTWEGYTTTSDAIGWTMTLQGNAFYVITFPTADATWMYNTRTQRWNKWSAWPYYNRHRANCYAYFNKKHLVGDYNNGKIYELDKDVFKDNYHPDRRGGELIKRVGTVRAIDSERKQIFHHELQLVLEMGAGFEDKEFWQDRLDDVYFTATGGFTWDDVEEQWTATSLGSGSGAGSYLPVTGSWYEGYRPSGIRVTFSGPSSITLDVTDGGGASATTGYESGVDKDVDFDTDDLTKLAFSAYSSDLTITKIEFYENFRERTDPECMLTYTNDRGHTYSDEQWQDIGAIGEHEPGVRWRRLGRSRDRIYKFTFTDPVKFVALGAYLLGETGEG